MPDDTIIIAEYDNPHRADMAKLRLEAEGIPVHLENRFIVETDWLLANAVGNIRLHVPAQFEQQAREILAAIKPASRHMGDAAEISSELKCLNCGAVMSEDDAACPACGWTYESSPDELDDEEDDDVEEEDEVEEEGEKFR